MADGHPSAFVAIPPPFAAAVENSADGAGLTGSLELFTQQQDDGSINLTQWHKSVLMIGSHVTRLLDLFNDVLHSTRMLKACINEEIRARGEDVRNLDLAMGFLVKSSADAARASEVLRCMKEREGGADEGRSGGGVEDEGEGGGEGGSEERTNGDDAEGGGCSQRPSARGAPSSARTLSRARSARTLSSRTPSARWRGGDGGTQRKRSRRKGSRRSQRTPTREQSPSMLEQHRTQSHGSAEGDEDDDDGGEDEEDADDGEEDEEEEGEGEEGGPADEEPAKTRMRREKATDGEGGGEEDTPAAATTATAKTTTATKTTADDDNEVDNAAEVDNAEDAMAEDWQGKMLRKIASGDLPRTPNHLIPVSILRSLGVMGMGNVIIFADTPDVMRDLGVPSTREGKRGALQILRTLGASMGLDHAGKFEYHTHLRMSHDRRGDCFNWFAIAESSLEAFKANAMEASKDNNLETMTAALAQAKMDPVKLANAIGEDGNTNCGSCTMSVLDPQDSQFSDKASLIAKLCHCKNWMPRIRCGTRDQAADEAAAEANEAVDEAAAEADEADGAADEADEAGDVAADLGTNEAADEAAVTAVTATGSAAADTATGSAAAETPSGTALELPETPSDSPSSTPSGGHPTTNHPNPSIPTTPAFPFTDHTIATPTLAVDLSNPTNFVDQLRVLAAQRGHTPATFHAPLGVGPSQYHQGGMALLGFSIGKNGAALRVAKRGQSYQSPHERAKSPKHI